MKIISTKTYQKTCTRCESVVEMFNYEMHKIQPTDDYDPQDIGRIYWRCPVCGISNWVETDDVI
jgi:hypothetical protein